MTRYVQKIRNGSAYFGICMHSEVEPGNIEHGTDDLEVGANEF